MKLSIRSFFTVALFLCTQMVFAQSTGTLVFDVKPFTSEVELKPKIEKQLKSGGIEWGMKDQQLVVTIVNKRFVNADISNLTRYGERKEISLPAGNYIVQCVGLVMEGGMSVEKVLSKGGYFNIDVMHFSIKAGETTTLEVNPAIRKQSTFLLKFFMPDLTIKVIQNGALVSEKVINARTDASIPWDKYDGPLKFVAK